MLWSDMSCAMCTKHHVVMNHVVLIPYINSIFGHWLASLYLCFKYLTCNRTPADTIHLTLMQNNFIVIYCVDVCLFIRSISLLVVWFKFFMFSQDVQAIDSRLRRALPAVLIVGNIFRGSSELWRIVHSTCTCWHLRHIDWLTTPWTVITFWICSPVDVLTLLNKAKCQRPCPFSLNILMSQPDWL